jgi:tripartite-type tricarboxylate transporter receptor subunit TctC
MSIRLLSAGLTVLVLSHGGAFSQNWPNRPVRLIVPFPAGGAVDVLARTVFDKVTAQVGQAFVIENRLGAGGTIGSAAVANAAPDGYTILVNSSSHTVAPALFGNLSYDAVRDSRRHPAGKPTDRAVRLR